MQDELIGLIYDAALDAARWPAVLERVSDALHSGPAALLLQNQLDRSGTGIVARLDRAALDGYYGDIGKRNPLLAKNDLAWLRSSGKFGAVTDRAILDKRDLMRSEFYNDFMKPNGMHSCLMLGMSLHGDSVATFNVMRPANREEFDADEIHLGERLRPHLSRAFDLCLRLEETRGREDALMEHLNRSPHGVFLLDRDGRVTGANGSGEAMLRRGDALRARDRRLEAAATGVTRKLQVLIADATSDGKSGGSLSLPRADGGLALSAIVASVSADTSPFGTGPAAILCVSDPKAGVVLPAQQLRELFGLTPAEARVALELMAGRDLKSAGERLGIRFNTARVHLARILDKTRTTRQAELVGLLLRLAGLH